MKKLMLAGALALAVVPFAEQPAAAWINFKFGVGLNWNWQSGGNNTLWGLFRNGQPPGSCGPDPSMLGGGMGGGGCNPFQCGPQGYCPPQGGCYMPQNCPQQNCPQRAPMYFPGYNPYTNSEFQYFGQQQYQPPAGTPDAGQSASALAASSYGQQYQQSAYQNPYSTTLYYPPAYYYPSSGPCNYGYNFAYQR